MKYTEFLERVRREVSIYTNFLTLYLKGHREKEEVEKLLETQKKEIAKLIKEYEEHKDDKIHVTPLCPKCNIVLVNKESGEGYAVFPAQVGQTMVHVTDIWQAYSGYECKLCGYQNLKKIEHWE